jgi:tRNA-dihydrouridine synthase
MTVDDTLVDRYEITRYVFQNPALFRIKYNTLVDGENTTRAIFKAFREWTEETHKSPTTPMVEKLKVHLSVLANISETDLMDERALINYLKEFIRKVDHKLA